MKKKKLIHFSRKRRQHNFKIKTFKRYALALLTLLGSHQMNAQSVEFAPPNFDPFQLYNNGYIRDSVIEFQSYKQFIDVDEDGDLDLIFFNLYRRVYSSITRNYYFQENTITDNGRFGDTNRIVFENDIEINPLSKLNYSDFDEDGDFDHYAVVLDDFGSSNALRFKIFENTSSSFNGFIFNDTSIVAQEELCFTAYEHSCWTYFDLGDLNGDSSDDLLIIDTQFEGDELDMVQFLYYQNNGNGIIDPFTFPEINPFNLGDVINHIYTDSNQLIMDIYLHDLNNDLITDLVVYHWDKNNGKFLLECFFRDHQTMLFDHNLSQVLLELTGSEEKILSGVYYGQPFFFIDLDEDGDLDLYHHPTIALYYNGFYEFDQSLYYYENLSTVTSLPFNESLEYSISPHPMQHQTTVQFENKLDQQAELNIFDVMGRLVQTYTGFTDQITIEKQNLPTGVYTFQIKMDGKIASDLLIIQ